MSVMWIGVVTAKSCFSCLNNINSNKFHTASDMERRVAGASSDPICSDFSSDHAMGISLLWMEAAELNCLCFVGCCIS